MSDYAAGGPAGWKELDAVLDVLGRQDIGEPVEFLLCESEKFRDSVPASAQRLLPSLKIILTPAFSSYEIKNDGVRAASGEFVAILDADCIPTVSWLRHLVAPLRARPDIAVVSGRTKYPSGSLFTRLCSLLGRAYVDPGREGPTQFIAINNCAFRREAYLAAPLPTDLGSFSSGLQVHALRRAGWTLWFDPDIQAVHDFEGLSMEADFRRNCGHGTILTRLEDPSMPYAWLTKLGRASIAPILAGKIFDSWGDCVRCGPKYGVRWFEVPAAMAMTVGLHLLEIPGMLRAFRRMNLRSSTFR